MSVEKELLNSIKEKPGRFVIEPRLVISELKEYTDIMLKSLLLTEQGDNNEICKYLFITIHDTHEKYEPIKLGFWSSDTFMFKPRWMNVTDESSILKNLIPRYLNRRD